MEKLAMETPTCSAPNGCQIKWSAVAVLIAGPDTDLSFADNSLGGAGAIVGDASAVREDGRVFISASGLCFFDAAAAHSDGAEGGRSRSSGDGPHAVVLTSAAAMAPFLARRPRRVREAHALQPALDVAVVPTVEIFVLVSADDAESQPAEGHAPSRAFPATLVACMPVRSAEESFGNFQGGFVQKPKTATSGETLPAAVEWSPPSIGSLGVAVLHVDWASFAAASCIGHRFSADAYARHSCASAVLPGSPVSIHASPFGTLKPSLFVNAEVQGAVAGISHGGSLLILDARCLPGSEGGVVTVPNMRSGSQPGDCAGGRTSYVQDGHVAAAGTHGEEGPFVDEHIPIALVAPPLRGSSGERLCLGAAIPLSVVANAILQDAVLPERVLRKLLGQTLLDLFRGVLAACSCEAIPEQRRTDADTVFDPASDPCVGPIPPSWLASHTCVLTTPDGSASAGAAVLAKTCLVLTSAGFVAFASANKNEAETSNAGETAVAEFRCRIRGCSDAGVVASSVLVRAIVVHTFKSIRGAVLLNLRSEVRDDTLLDTLSPLPWCSQAPVVDEVASPTNRELHQPAVPRNAPVEAACSRPDLASDCEAVCQEGAAVVAVTLQSRGGFGVARGFVTRVFLDPRSGKHILLQASFVDSGRDGCLSASADSVDSDLVLLLSLQPRVALLGFQIDCDFRLDAGALFSCSWLAFATAELVPLLRLLAQPTALEPRLIADLARWDEDWHARAAEGVAQLLWHVEAGRTTAHAQQPFSAIRRHPRPRL